VLFNKEMPIPWINGIFSPQAGQHACIILSSLVIMIYIINKGLSLMSAFDPKRTLVIFRATKASDPKSMGVAQTAHHAAACL